MGTTIFVIGASGHIGAALLETLAGADARVIAGAHS
ncbi:MAG TPA: 2-deoxy-D-gluconate 3-dehydrogenase, partial [Planctomycetes bacterium]|nr:2-deoxy-D-gluconate 3-dehydrogenase [Planctomycetota bacterium]